MSAAVLLAAVLSVAMGAAQPAPQIVYASDWSGSAQVYSVDPAVRRTGQLTFGRPPVCTAGNPCGYTRPVPSPDGRRVLFWDFVRQAQVRASLYVARADGRRRQRLVTVDGVFQPDAVWAPDSRRIAYTVAGGVRVVRVDGSRDRVASASDPGRFSWSADGRFLATLSSDGVLAIAGGRKVALGVGDVSWAPRGDRLAYLAGGDVYLVRANGRGRRRLVDLPDANTFVVTSEVEWSPSGRWIAFTHGDDAYLASAASGATRPLGKARCCARFTWAPGGRTLAFASRDQGLVLVDPASGATRVLDGHAVDVSWSPTGTSVAYVLDTTAPLGLTVYARSDLRVATLRGAPRTVVAATGAYGGSICCVGWTRPPRGTSYRAPAQRSPASVAPGELVATAPVTRLVADGNRVAYVSCGHVFTWTPATGEVRQAEPQASFSPNCSSPTYNAGAGIGGLALAGDRIAYLWTGGGNSRVWWLGSLRLPARSAARTLGFGTATNAPFLRPVFGSLVGWPMGAGDLLVFSGWTEAREPEPVLRRTERQGIHLVGPDGCPCPEIASSPGPLVPYDVDTGRIVAGGDNATVVYDRHGSQLLAVPVSPLAAQLAGNDLVALRQGGLRVYDATSGALRRTWPMPDVPSGTECSRLACAGQRLVLVDLARGLAAYVVDGDVRVLRLVDGADASVGRGVTARFVEAGLVLADGVRLRLVPFERLPLR